MVVARVQREHAHPIAQALGLLLQDVGSGSTLFHQCSVLLHHQVKLVHRVAHLADALRLFGAGRGDLGNQMSCLQGQSMAGRRGARDGRRGVQLQLSRAGRAGGGAPRKTQTKLTSQGQVSVPAAVRSFVHLIPGSVRVWSQEGDRIFVERAKRHSTAEVHRALFADRADGPSTSEAPRTPKELKHGIRQRLQRRHARA